MANPGTLKTLFLFTKTYPFGPGEQYITSELQFLSGHFQKIIIYPNDYYSEGLAHDKDLPPNAEILNLNQTLTSKNKNGLSDYVYLLKNTFSEWIATDDRTNFFKNFKWNLLNFWTQYQLAKNFTVYLDAHNYTSDNAVFYSYWFHKSALLLSVLKDKKRISQFVSRAHSIDLYHQYWGVINEEAKVPSFKMFKYKHVYKIITISKHGLNFIQKHFPKYAGKPINFYLGVPGDTSGTEPKPGEQFLMVTCSHLEWTKRVDKLAEALTKMTQPCKWVHFGGGSEIDLNKIKAAQQKMPAHIQVELKGYVSNQEIHNFYNTNFVNLFVNLSLVEGVPVSIMEALSHGIPVLATAVYGTPEAVIDGKNGFLIDVDFTEKELTDKLNFCITHKDQLLEMGKNSYGVFRETFNAEKNYTDFANYLESL